MASPRLTLSLAAAVHPWLKFRRACRAAFGAAFAQEDVAFLLQNLQRSNQTWEEGDERMGWRLLPPAGEGSGFLGLYLGPESVHKESPDLYFFLEVPRGTLEQEAVDEHSEDIQTAIATLNGLGLNVYWGYTPGGTHGVWAVMSVLDALRSGDAEASVCQFVTHTLTYARDTGLTRLFLGETFAPEPRVSDTEATESNQT